VNFPGAGVWRECLDGAQQGSSRWAVGLEQERDMWERLHDIVIKCIWAADTSLIARPRRFIIESLRFTYLIAGDLLKGQLSLRAMSLVYTTMLSLVPLLAVTFSVLKGFGVHNRLEPLLSNVLAALGPKGAEVTATIIGFVDNIKVGVLGSVGLALLVYFVISLVYKVESTLNFIWRIKKPRRLVQRFSEYLSVILVGPVLMFAALGITASISSTTIFQELLTCVICQPTGPIFIGVCGIYVYLHLYSAHASEIFFCPRGRCGSGGTLADSRVDIRIVCRVVGKICGNLLELCRARCLYDLDLRELVYPSYWRASLVLRSKSTVAAR
jgi:membrane protein